MTLARRSGLPLRPRNRKTRRPAMPHLIIFTFLCVLGLVAGCVLL